MKKLLTLVFGLGFSTVVFADFAGQTIGVDYVATAGDPLSVAAMDTTSVAAPSATGFAFDGPPPVNCNIAVAATQITIGPCDFGPFGDGGGAITFNGFRFTAQNATITGVTPPGAVPPTTTPTTPTDTIIVNLIGQNLLDPPPVVLDVTFAAAPGGLSIPVLPPLALAAVGALLAGLGARQVRRQRKK